MGKVESIHIPGLSLWFPSSDHLPPHFHVKKRGEWHYRVRFLESREAMLELKWASKPMKRSERNSLCALVVANRDKLLKEWERKAGNAGVE